MLKRTQRDLKKEFKSINANHKEAMALKCVECMGFFIDGYEKCSSTTCPLKNFYPLSSFLNSHKFIDKMKALATSLGNDNYFVSKLGRRLSKETRRV